LSRDNVGRKIAGKAEIEAAFAAPLERIKRMLR
jgi:hypothetical protein